MSTLRSLTVNTLPVVSALAAYFCWYLAFNNGTLANLHTYHTPGTFLPGTRIPIKQEYTGIPLIDRQLRLLVPNFWPLIADQVPSSTIHIFDFAFQFMVAYAMVMLEAARPASNGLIIAWVSFFGLSMQVATWAVTIPLWCFLHLVTSAVAARPSLTILVPDPATLAAIPVALLIGYVVPTHLQSLPSPNVISHDDKQVYNAIWQVFPVSVAILTPIISFVMSGLVQHAGSSDPAKRYPALRWYYSFFINVARFGRVWTLTMILNALRSPALFAPAMLEHITFWKVYVPMTVLPSVQVASVGDGINMLLQYDLIFGSIAIMLWTGLLRFDTVHERHSVLGWAWKAVGIVTNVIVAGPAGAALELLRQRDEELYEKYQLEQAVVKTARITATQR